MTDILVVGAGGMGAATALELARRGHRVRLLDSGPLPNPDAASTDRNKVVRADYGGDVFYTELAREAIDRWLALNLRWGRKLFHPCGVTVLRSEPMVEGSFEGDSYALLTGSGQRLERLDSDSLARGASLWNPEMFCDGYFNDQGGWVESSAAVAAFLKDSQALLQGTVRLCEGVKVTGVLRAAGRVQGVATTQGELLAEAVVVAAGKWTSSLLPEMREQLQPTAQPVFYFRPTRPELFRPPNFSVWTADIAKSGWYGFPAAADGVVKVARHGAGVPLDPEEKVPPVASSEEERCREFLSQAIPALAAAPLVGTRSCVYCDSRDGDFVVAPVPTCSGLFVVSGGSGHAFKFIPVLGEIAADVVEGRSNRFAKRFGWRLVHSGQHEAARCSS